MPPFGRLDALESASAGRIACPTNVWFSSPGGGVAGGGADAGIGALGGLAQVQRSARSVASREQELSEFQMGLEIVGERGDRQTVFANGGVRIAHLQKEGAQTVMGPGELRIEAQGEFVAAPGFGEAVAADK